ncbi:hypothetical protein, partial [Paramuribaculum intestinale]|uniref:hypothetical protein n=1 Tax=Paramuribaculum intestinale TaxID=2094151 RepID=UPI0025B0992C
LHHRPRLITLQTVILLDLSEATKQPSVDDFAGAFELQIAPETDILTAICLTFAHNNVNLR